MSKISDLSLSDYFERLSYTETFQKQLSVIDMGNIPDLDAGRKNYPMRLKAYSLLLVLAGEIKLGINYDLKILTGNTIMQLSPNDIIEHTAYSSDFKGYLIICSAGLRAEMLSMTASIQLQKAEQLKYIHPMQRLTEEQKSHLIIQVELIKKYIADKAHLHYDIVIKNQVINLFLDIDSIRWSKYGDGEIQPSRNEILRWKFRELLVQNCRQHRDVGFYADKLCVTADHLSRVVREFDRQSAGKWITNAVITEAKILLRKPDKTINQIAQDLNFPDQSTFGKFFKRNIGVSPLEYRK